MHKHNFKLWFDPEMSWTVLWCDSCNLEWKDSEIIELIEQLMEDVNKMAPLFEAHFPKANIVYPEVETTSNYQTVDRDSGFIWLSGDQKC